MIRVEGLTLLNEKFFQESLSEMEKVLLEELKLLWAKEKDPHGKAWERRQQPTGSWPVLYKTGELQSSAKIIISPSGQFFAHTEPYGMAHQLGAGVPQRQMFGLPDKFVRKAEEILWKNLSG